MKEFWKWGQKGEMAEAVGLSRPYFSDLLARRRTVSPMVARKLVKASMRILGEGIPLEAWLYKDEKHPAFKPFKRKGL